MTRERRLRIALGLNLAVVAGQLVAGALAHSLGLLADAGHNATDAAALLLSLNAVRWARRRPTRDRSFGYHRTTILAAQANAAVLLGVTAVVAFEAVRRLAGSGAGHVRGGVVVVVALVVTAVNISSARVLREHGRDLNMRAAAMHLTGDALASLGVAAAGAVILATGTNTWLDPAVSLAVAVLIAWQATQLLRATVDVLLESTPPGLDLDDVTALMAAVDGVDEVHDLHVWGLSDEVRVLSAHVVLSGHPTLEEAQAVGTRVKATVSEAYAIAHATLELECEGCVDDGSWCAIQAREHR